MAVLTIGSSSSWESESQSPIPIFTFPPFTSSFSFRTISKDWFWSTGDSPYPCQSARGPPSSSRACCALEPHPELVSETISASLDSAPSSSIVFISSPTPGSQEDPWFSDCLMRSVASSPSAVSSFQLPPSASHPDFPPPPSHPPPSSTAGKVFRLPHQPTRLGLLTRRQEHQADGGAAPAAAVVSAALPPQASCGTRVRRDDAANFLAFTFWGSTR